MFLPEFASGKLKSLDMKLKCSKLVAIAVLASEKRIYDGYIDKDSDDNETQEKLKCQLKRDELAKVSYLKGVACFDAHASCISPCLDC